MKNVDFTGQVALVTGGSRSIGRAIARELAARGAAVAVNYQGDQAAAAETVAAIQAEGGQAVAVRADVADPDQVRSLFETTHEALGPVSLLVNNAAVLYRTPLLDITPDEWRRTLEVNLTGAFLVAQTVARNMVSHSGRGAIVNVSSINQSRARPGLAHYSSSKAGLGMLTRQLALELAPSGIRVNAVALGMIETDMNRARLADPETRARQENLIPLGRVGEPADTAGPVLFLLSEWAQLITGATLVVDGGRSLT